MSESPAVQVPPLSLVRIVELSDGEPMIQLAGRLLVRLGARVERFSGDGQDAVVHDLPQLIDELGSASVFSRYANAGKMNRSLVDTAALRDAVESADLVLTSRQAVGAVESGYRQRLVVGSYGSTGPKADWPSSALTRQHASGIGYLTIQHGDPDGRPTSTKPYVVESFAAVGIAAAALGMLLRVERFGVDEGGVDVDFSAQEHLINLHKMFLFRGARDRAQLDRINHAYDFGGNMRAADGFVSVAALEQHQWRELCDMIGRPEWKTNPAFIDGLARKNNAAEISSVLSAWCAERKGADILALASEHGLPSGPVRTPGDVLAEQSFYTRPFLRRLENGAVDVGLPYGAGLEAARDETSAPLDARPRVPSPAADGRAAAAPLSGVRVLDFTWAGAGPFVTNLCVYLGATVFKVESAARPDLMRVANRAYGFSDKAGLEESPVFAELNAGKKSVEIDLSKPGGRALAKRMALASDVLVENMRPGKIEALGLGYDELVTGNPRLVMCSISATGRGGGLKEPPPGYAPVFWAAGGGSWATGSAVGSPGYMRSPVDFYAGSVALVGILAALHQRLATGRGRYVDCSAIEACAMAIGDDVFGLSRGVEPFERNGARWRPFAPHDTFPTSDGAWVAISVQTNEQWRAAAQVLGLIPDERYTTAEARWAAGDELYALVAAVTAQRTAGDLIDALSAAGVPADRSADLVSLVDDEHLRERRFWQTIHHPVLGEQTIAGPAWRAPWPRPDLAAGGPLLGEHTAAAIEDLLGGRHDR